VLFLCLFVKLEETAKTGLKMIRNWAASSSSYFTWVYGKEFSCFTTKSANTNSTNTFKKKSTEQHCCYALHGFEKVTKQWYLVGTSVNFED